MRHPIVSWIGSSLCFLPVKHRLRWAMDCIRSATDNGACARRHLPLLYLVHHAYVTQILAHSMTVPPELLPSHEVTPIGALGGTWWSRYINLTLACLYLRTATM